MTAKTVTDPVVSLEIPEKLGIASNKKYVYRWFYRPEVQYSMVDFDPTKIKKTSGQPADAIINLVTDPKLVQQLVDGYTVITGPQLANQFLAPLDRFSTPQREFTIQLYTAEGKAVPITITIDQNGVATISDPTALSTTDFSMLSLFQTDDPENVLWSNVDNIITLITSDDPESRSNNSFIVFDPAHQYGITGTKRLDGKALATAPPIKAKLIGSLADEATTDIEWQIEAVGSVTPRTYGGIYEVKYGVTNDTRAAISAADGSGNRCLIGTDGKEGTAPWKSGKQPLSAAKEVTFRPCPPSHYTAAYDTTGNSGGTKSIDVHRKNPRLAYKVSATVYEKGKPARILHSVTARMDEKDMLREEYITHVQSASSTINTVKVPARDDIVEEASLRSSGYWGSYTNTDLHTGYPYKYVINDGMVKMWTDFEAAFDLYAMVAPNALTADQTAFVTSAYRNPERNEAIPGKAASRHMLGRALDISVNNIGSYGTLSRGEAFYKVWEGIHRLKADTAATYNPTRTATGAPDRVPWADFWQLEDSGSHAVLTSSGGWALNKYSLDNSGSGIPDGYEQTGHLHIQDNPNEGNHK